MYRIVKNIDLFSPIFIVSFYFILQQLFLPIYNFIFLNYVFNDAFYFALSGIIFFILGCMTLSSISYGLKKISYDRNLRFCSKSIIFTFLLLSIFSILLKFRVCLDLNSNLSCYSSITKIIFAPTIINMLTFLFVFSILKVFNYSKLIVVINFLLIGIFTCWLYFFESRFRIISFLFSCIVVEYYINRHNFSLKKSIGILLVILTIWFSLSWIKIQGHDVEFLKMLTLQKFLLSSTIGRVCQDHIFSKVVENWDAPYMLFESWPDFFNQLFYLKLNHLDGNDFGKNIVLGFDDHVTGVGPTFFGDLYMNGNLVGLYIGMYIIGIIYTFIHKLKSLYGGTFGIFLYASLLPILVQGSEDFVFLTLARIVNIFILFNIIVFIYIFSSNKFFLPVQYQRRLS